MTTPTTTTKLIRDKQSALIEALTPRKLATDLFREYSDEMDFRDWAEATGRAALRMFYIEDLGPYELPLISDTLKEQQITNFEVLVAYPKDGRYGDRNRASMLDVMTQDMHDIDTAIGIRGTADYVSGQDAALAIEKTIDPGDAVDFLMLTFEVIFRRDMQ